MPGATGTQGTQAKPWVSRDFPQDVFQKISKKHPHPSALGQLQAPHGEEVQQQRPSARHAAGRGDGGRGPVEAIIAALRELGLKHAPDLVGYGYNVWSYGT